MFKLRLSIRFGRPYREMLATMTSEDLTLYRAFDQIEPIGDWRHDLGYGVIASTLANIHRKASAQPFAPSDFMPLYPKPKLSVAQQLREALVKAGARFKGNA